MAASKNHGREGPHAAETLTQWMRRRSRATTRECGKRKRRFRMNGSAFEKLRDPAGEPDPAPPTSQGAGGGRTEQRHANVKDGCQRCFRGRSHRQRTARKSRYHFELLHRQKFPGFDNFFRQGQREHAICVPGDRIVLVDFRAEFKAAHRTSNLPLGIQNTIAFRRAALAL